MATRADGVTIREAAQALGITEPAVRQRLQRRTLKSYRADGRVFVILPDGAEQHEGRNGVSHGVSSDATQALHALVEQLRSENTLIREQLTIKDRQITELHVLLQTAQRQLTAGAPVAGTDGADNEPSVSRTNTAPEPPQREPGASAPPRRRGWLARFFRSDE
jgi:hypothetical protein